MILQFDRFPDTTREEVHIGHKEIDAAYKRALDILKDPIDPGDFTDYKDVEKDIAFVKKMEADFWAGFARKSPYEQRIIKLSKILEAIIFEHGEKSNWFGESATTIQTSRFDDIVHHVDTIIEFTEGVAGASHLSVAIDVTIGNKIDKKFDYIKQCIDAGKLTEIKYFVSEFLGFHGRKTNVPHVILGIDKKAAYSVADAWIKGDMKKLATHPIQITILEEMRVQLQAFMDYAKKIGKDEIVRIFEKTLGIVQSIMDSKEITARDTRNLDAEDDMFYAVKFAAEPLEERK